MIDVDKLFEKYLRDYLAQNAGKFSEAELEDKVSELYESFGKTRSAELGGVTPEEYFSSKTPGELAQCLKECVVSGTAVSDFLCEAIEKCDDIDKYLISFVSEGIDDELSAYCVNLLNDRGSKECFDKYLELILSGKCDENLTELLTETLSSDADKIADKVVSVYDNAENAKQYLIEILVNASARDEIFDILCKEFVGHDDNIALYTSYLAKYGDERALPLLKDKIKDESLSYVDYKELKLAIEELGGEYVDERDFSKDKYYSILKKN